MPEERVGQVRHPPDAVNASMGLLETSARVGVVRLASSTALRLDHKPSTGLSYGA